jgi:hypothetical protein
MINNDMFYVTGIARKGIWYLKYWGRENNSYLETLCFLCVYERFPIISQHVVNHLYCIQKVLQVWPPKMGGCNALKVPDYQCWSRISNPPVSPSRALKEQKVWHRWRYFGNGEWFIGASSIEAWGSHTVLLKEKWAALGSTPGHMVLERDGLSRVLTETTVGVSLA